MKSMEQHFAATSNMHEILSQTREELSTVPFEIGQLKSRMDRLDLTVGSMKTQLGEVSSNMVKILEACAVSILHNIF
ncbi:hypothetical protein K440DRAFT_625879 [Wilcoxina mikolae CBS 423.85]|nr:hypothetical protein K440DRAFT_625879 [Wilcoxina mikolae CBS 423.85]